MNKKIKYLSLVPLYGTVILLVYLYILCLREKISRRKFFKNFIICGCVSAICWYTVMMIIYIVSQKMIPFDFYNLGLFLTIIVGGYMMNAFTFKFISMKWDSMSCNETEEKICKLLDKNKIVLIAFILALVITVLAVVAIIAFDLI